MRLSRSLVVLPFLALPVAAQASDSSFLANLQGNWTGSGSVLRNIGASPINVSCKFKTSTTGTSFNMNGTCRGLLVISRSISANLKANGNRYTGTYTGPSGAHSGLSGSRKGNTINLAVRWAKEVNGDKKATMTIRKIGDNGLELRTIDKDLKTGRNVVTSNITLKKI